MDKSLLEMLACPQCRGPLRHDGAGSEQVVGEQVVGELVCTSAACGLAYPIRGGVPVLLIDAARAARPQV
ncbi:MAG: Trm112 family protein [Sporichthyaceae bacterium]